MLHTTRRPSGRWVDNIRMDLGEVGWGDVAWIGLAQDRDSWRALVNVVVNFGSHNILGNYRIASQLVALSSSAQLYRVSLVIYMLHCVLYIR
jgi:hypothetical protein